MYFSKRWLDMSEIYKMFSKDIEGVDYSEKSKEQMYLFESKGIKFDNPMNGYFLGKKWMDVTVEMWNQGIKDGIVTKYELMEDGYPKWWLDKVIKY